MFYTVQIRKSYDDSDEDANVKLIPKRYSNFVQLETELLMLGALYDLP